MKPAKRDTSIPISGSDADISPWPRHFGGKKNYLKNFKKKKYLSLWGVFHISFIGFSKLNIVLA
jgi:hypothetical protein